MTPPKPIPEADPEKQLKALEKQSERWLFAGAVWAFLAYTAAHLFAGPAYANGLALGVFWLVSLNASGELRSIKCKLEHLQEMGIRRELEVRRE